MLTIKEKREAAVTAFIECRKAHKAEIDAIQAECEAIGHVNAGNEHSTDNGDRYYICDNCKATVNIII